MRIHVVLFPCCAMLFGCGASPTTPGADASASPADVSRSDASVSDAPASRDVPEDRRTSTDADEDLCAAACRLVVMARCEPSVSPADAEASCLRSCRQDPENNPGCRAQSTAYTRCAVAAGVPQCREGQPRWAACAAVEETLNACILSSNNDASTAPDDASAPVDDAPEDVAEAVTRCSDYCAAQQAPMCTSFDATECVRVCRQQVIFVSPRCRAQHRARADCRVGARYTCNSFDLPGSTECDALNDAVTACEQGPIDGGM